MKINYLFLLPCSVDDNRRYTTISIWLMHEYKDLKSLLSIVDVQAPLSVSRRSTSFAALKKRGKRSSPMITGNFSADPLFCLGTNPEDPLSLCADSPCLPSGNDCGVLIGAHDEGCGECDDPVESSSWGSIKALFR